MLRPRSHSSLAAQPPLMPVPTTISVFGLTLPVEALPDGEFDLEIVTHIKPQENSLLEGLYKSGGNFCSQVRSLVTLIPKGIHWMFVWSTFLKMCCSVRQKGSGA